MLYYETAASEAKVLFQYKKFLGGDHKVCFIVVLALIKIASWFRQR
jgi:hypothetical protein